MSLEQAIAALTAAVNANTAALQAAGHAPAVATPVQTLGVAAAQVQQPATGMPAAPTFGFQMPAATPVAQAPVAPFSTQQELFNYTGSTYQAMGAEKGAKIQGILTGLGIANLNDLKPEQYGTFYAQVEALKAGA